MNVIDAIFSRRSCRRFRSDPVAVEHLEQLLAAAVRAPNHHLTEPWHFYVVRGDGLRQVAALRAGQMRQRGESDEGRIERNVREITGIPVIIFVSSAAGWDPTQTRENYAATCCAVQNLLLAAHGLGLGVMWRTGRFLRYAPLRDFLGVPEHAELVASLYVGYPDGDPDGLPESPRSDWRTKTTWL